MTSRPQLLLFIDGSNIPCMAAIESTMLALGTPAPAFRLADFNGKVSSLEDFAAARGLVVAFICNHCPYVKHMRNEFARFARDYQAKGLGSRRDLLERHRRLSGGRARRHGGRSDAAPATRFRTCFDETQSVAKAYDAACTPDLYLFDGQRKLVYRGQFDDSRPGRGTATGKDLRAACDAVLSGAGRAGRAEAEHRLQHQVEDLTP